LAKQVFFSLREAVFNGELQPGEAIREMHVARIMQVSQATVREALVQLQQTGLVVREQNRRTTVTAFSREEIRDRIAMRTALEELAAVEASRRLSADDIQELERRAMIIDRKIDAGNSLEHVNADMSFHHYVWERCGNAILLKTLENTTAPLFAFTSVLVRAGLVDLQAAKPHQRIVDAIVSRDPERIRQEIRLHMETSYQGFLNTGLPSLDALVHSGVANGKTNGVSHSAAAS
jgi:DNA-binding GntR family transcriptional regulator